MPFSAHRNRRKARKSYYEKFALKAKVCSNQYYYANRVSVIGKVLEQKRLVRHVNPDKAKEDNKKFVAQHRVDNPLKASDATISAVRNYRLKRPQKAADATRTAARKHRLHNPHKAAAAVKKHRLENPHKAAAAVQKYRQRHPAYSKAQNRRLVSAHYHKNTEHSRLLSRTSTARQYMKHLQATRLKSRRTSKKYYEKKSSAIKARRQSYLLVEPSNEVVNRVMTTLQDTLCRDKAVVDEILEGLNVKKMLVRGTLKNVNPLKCPHVN